MKKWVEDLNVLRESLRDAHIGQWMIEIDEGKEPRLYADDTFFSMMGMDADASPEEEFRFWNSHVAKRDRTRTEIYLQKMIQTGHSEIKYAWLHPDGNEMYIRCEGRRDPSYKPGIRLRGSHQDISEIVNMRRELLDREQDYKQLDLTSKKQQNILNTIPGGVGVVRYDGNGVWTPEFLSEGFAAMTGMTLDQAWELYRKNAMSGVHPDDVPELTRELNEFISSDRENIEMTYRLRRGDGSYFWVKNTMTVTVDEKGEKRSYCVFSDMTREMAEHEALSRQYRERLSQHYRATGPDVLIVGHCNITQSKIVEIIDYTDSFLIEKFGNERNAFCIGLSGLVVDEKERKEFLNSFLNDAIFDAYNSGKTEFDITCFICLPSNKHECYAQFKEKLMTDPDTGDLTGIITVTDVTERIITNKTMQKLSMLECDFVADVDLYTDTQTILLLTSLQSVSDKRSSFSEYKENAINTRVMSKDRDKLSSMLDPDYILEQLRTNDIYSFMYEIKDENGQIRTKKLTVAAVDLRLGRICLARVDMTKELETERNNQIKLEQALKLSRQASKAKSEFLSSMSHDIRTPMNAILGMTELARTHMYEPERLEGYLNKILLSGKHLLGLINDILDMSKIEQGRLTINHEEVYLPDLLEEISDMFSSQAQLKGLDFTVKQKGISISCFYGDPLRVKQILINLVGNAVKFTSEGGQIILEVQEIKPHQSGHRVRYLFIVKDTGVGMSEEFLVHLFDPFVRGRDTDYVEGTGLGMSITKGIVDLMGGTITVESEERKGSTFRVELEFDYPLQSTPAQPDLLNKRVSRQILDGYRFLAAEDNELNAEILEEMLGMKGAEIYTVKNGALAVEEFKNSRPGTYDGILMDIQMPEMNGYDAARNIRNLDRPDAKTIPIVAMTANAFAEDVKAAFDAGMNAHLAKPVDMERAARLLRSLIRKNRG